jgi:hypothetical protein
LHAWSTARAPGRICAIAPDVESNKMTPVTTNFFFNMVCPPLMSGEMLTIAELFLLGLLVQDQSEFQAGQVTAPDLKDPARP